MIAIILVNYNNTNDTINCVDSIFKSEGINTPYVVVVDNDSKIKDIHLHLKQYQQVKVIYNKENVGFGRANNIGINWCLEHIESDFIFILNNDTIIDKFCLKNLKEHECWSLGEKYLLAPLILNMQNPSTIWYGGGSIDWKRGSAKMNYIGCRYISGSEVDKQRNVNFASGCALFLSILFLKELKGFDPFFFMYEEDVEFSIRINKMGGQIIYSPKAVVYHKCQGTAEVQTDVINQLDPFNPNLKFYLKHMILGRIYNIRKHANIYQKLKFYCFSFLYWNAKSVQYIYHRKYKAFLLVYKYWIEGLRK